MAFVVAVVFDDGDGVGADVLIADKRRPSARASQSQPVLEPSIKEEGGSKAWEVIQDQRCEGRKN